MEGKVTAGGMTNAKKVKAFWWLIGITVAYFAIYYLLIVETEACKAAGGFTIQDHWFHGFWDRYLACRQVNELGDALAGAFAPVAFLWLAGAVFIQSKELELQREEMDETRKVMKEQVDEMRASTALMKEQTDVIKQEQALRALQQLDREFDEMAEAFHDFLRSTNGFSLKYTLWSEPESKSLFNELGTPKNVRLFNPVREASIHDVLFTASREIVEMLPQLRNPRCIVDRESWDRTVFEFIRVNLRDLEAKQTTLSAPHQIKVRRMFISEILVALDELERLWQKAKSERRVTPEHS